MGQFYTVGDNLLEKPSLKPTQTELNLDIDNDIIGNIGDEYFGSPMVSHKLADIIKYKEDMQRIVGDLLNDERLQTSNSEKLKKYIIEIQNKTARWNGLRYLLSNNPIEWEGLLGSALALLNSNEPYDKQKTFIKILSQNWQKKLSALLVESAQQDISQEKFFDYEKNLTYNLAQILNDVCLIYNRINNTNIDISPFITKLSCAFLPPLVYHLEEYGLPRMISKKIHESNLIDLESSELTINQCLDRLKNIGELKIIQSTPSLDSFDQYILKHFFEGITILPRKTY